jgi:SOUL heme-binding protein
MQPFRPASEPRRPVVLGVVPWARRMAWFAILLVSAHLNQAMASSEAFSQAPVGAPEIATLPAGVLLKSSARGDYFEQADSLFWPLFRYIRDHSITMTTPVEASVDDASMFFWVSAADVPKASADGGGVAVVRVPERTVARLGARGSYSRENFEATRQALTRWLDSRKDVEASGPAYAVFWNGPFVPGFLKRFEVHIPVKPRSRTGS